MQGLMSIYRETWTMTQLMAPYLLMGFVLAGLLKAMVDAARVRDWLGRRGWASVLKASLVGVPLPLCSCGVIPVAASLRHQGASRGATVSFLASTPETGVDSIVATWGMLGPALAFVRVVTAFFTGITAGLLVDYFHREEDAAGAGAPQTSPERTLSPIDRFRQGIQFSFLTLPRELVFSLSLGLLLAGVAGAFIPPQSLSGSWTNGFLGYLAVASVAIPLYVCSTGSIPLAYSLMHAGFSPGAALVFLIAGPATNMATISTMGQLLGRKAVALYLAAILICSFTAAGLVDYAWPEMMAGPYAHHQHVHSLSPGDGNALAGIILCLLLLRGAAARLFPVMNRKPKLFMKSAPSVLSLTVVDMECAHCARTITEGLSSLPGVISVQTDAAKKSVAVAGQDLDPEKIKETVRRLGFQVG